MQYDASQAPAVKPGRLIYLMGPSGAGKDSLIDAVRPQLAQANVHVARRVITRSAEAQGEAAQSVSPARFHELLANDAFALHWQANDLAYGIPAHIDGWLRAGQAVLVNGSRAHLEQARRRYPDVLAVLLTVRPEVLRERLLKRGREDLEAIERRLARNAQVEVGEGVHIVDNSADLQLAVQRFMTLLSESGVL